MKPRIIILLILFYTLSLSALDAQHKIEFNIDNYDNDTLVIGYFVLDKQLAQDTLYSIDKGRFVLKDSLSTGVYLALTYPDNQYYQFLVNDFEKEFSMHCDYEDKHKVYFEGSHDNTCFQSYVDLLNVERPRLDSIRSQMSDAQEAGRQIRNYELQIEEINKKVHSYQDSLIESNPEYLSTLLLRSSKEIVLPEFEPSDEGRLAQYYYYKNHYFDYIDLSDPRALRTPFLFQRVNYYVDKLTPKHPDSVIVSIEYILDKMRNTENSFQYYLSHFLNQYAQTKIVGMDKVYVHLADNYYGKGLTPWATEETISKILDRANKIRPVLLGSITEDIEVYAEDGTPIKISDIDYEYLVLLFWAPDCGHCKKAMPGFIDFAERYKDQNIKVFAICTKYRDKVKNCWEYVKEKEMLGFINAADEFNRSDFKLKYYVNSTPKLYILDKNREILMKNVGVDQLDSVFESIFQQRESKPLENK